jgi:hypothetical protein
MATPNRGNVHAFVEKVGSNNGIYLKGKDFENTRKIRPIMWLKNGVPIDVLIYQEGWVNASDDKGKPLKNGKPVRFEADEEIPSLDWKMSAYMGGTPKAQTPKATISILGWDYETKALKISSFAQVSVTKAIGNMLSPTTEEGKENDFYIEDLTSVDLVIKKGAEDKDPWSITTKAPKTPGYDPDCIKALQTFEWSWDAFIACDQIEGHPTTITYADVLAVMNEGKPAETKAAPAAKQANKVTKPEPVKEVEEESSDFTYDAGWHEMKTQKGAVLGEQTLETLEGWKETMSKMKADGKKVSEPLLNAVLSGIKDLSDSSGQEDDPTAF